MNDLTYATLADHEQVNINRLIRLAKKQGYQAKNWYAENPKVTDVIKGPHWFLEGPDGTIWTRSFLEEGLWLLFFGWI